VYGGTEHVFKAALGADGEQLTRHLDGRWRRQPGARQELRLFIGDTGMAAGSRRICNELAAFMIASASFLPV
jgi:hypothetical protein